jgi:hypothetical protein
MVSRRVERGCIQSCGRALRAGASPQTTFVASESMVTYKINTWCSVKFLG